MIRWRHLLTRIAIIVVVVVLVRWAMGPTVQYATVQMLQKTTGGKVDIANTNVDLWPPRIYFESVQIADPSKEKEDAIRADLVDVSLKSSALVRRQWVVEKARVTGLKLNEARTENGQLTKSAPSNGPGFSDKLLSLLETQAKSQAEAFAKSLETVQVSDEIRSRWENEYASMITRAKGLEQEISEVRDSIRGIDNPLRDVPQLQQALEKAERIRQELLSLRTTIDEMPATIQTDYNRLNTARQNDMQRVGQYLPISNNGETDFTADMFRQLVTSQLDRVRSFLSGSRSVADWTIAKPDTDRERGIDINLLGGKLPPNWLIEEAEMSGFMQIDGQEYDLSGVFENITGDPERIDSPLVGRMRLDGPQIVRVDFKRHTEDEGNVWDEVTMHWPSLPISSLAVGDSENASIRMQPGGLELWVQMNIQGEIVNGRMISKMRNTSVDTNIASKSYNKALIDSLSASLQSVRDVDVEAKFAGQWSAMNINVASNLSGIFSNAMRHSVTAQTQATKQKLTAEVENAYRKQVVEIQGWVTKQQSEVQKALTKADISVEEISQKLVQQLGAPDLYLGRLRRGLQIPKF